MELLKIDASGDAFFNKDNEWASVRDIEQDDLLALIKAVAENSTVILDECTSDRDIKNPIEKTIYQEIYKQLKDLDEQREVYTVEIDKEFENLEQEYKIATD
jgi:hypothetical protein